MNRLILAAALAAGCTIASTTPALAVAKNYDCSKAGNANKAACKSARPAAAAPKAAATAKAAPAKAAPKVAATTTRSVTRSYDCTKAGNANKAQCKGKTSVATSTTKPAPAAAAKPGMFQRMKNALGGAPRHPRRHRGRRRRRGALRRQPPRRSRTATRPAPSRSARTAPTAIPRPAPAPARATAALPNGARLNAETPPLGGRGEPPAAGLLRDWRWPPWSRAFAPIASFAD